MFRDPKIQEIEVTQPDLRATRKAMAAELCPEDEI
jgi:hypothetical protein